MEITTLALQEIVATNHYRKIVLNTYFELPLHVVITPREKIVRKVTYSKNEFLGDGYSLPMAHYLAVLLTQNEIQGMTGKPSDKHGIRRKFQKEYRKLPYKKIQRFFITFATKRRLYNKAELYSHQPKPLLYVWTYSPKGYIIHPIYRSQMLTFDHCVGILRNDKFMDPRFFTKDEILRAMTSLESGKKTFLGWNIPSIAEIEKVEKKIGKPLFNSITFPSGYGHNNT